MYDLLIGLSLLTAAATLAWGLWQPRTSDTRLPWAVALGLCLAGALAWLERQAQRDIADLPLAEVIQRVASSNYSTDDFLVYGRGIYRARCAGCHQESGNGLPGVTPPLRLSAVVQGPIRQHAARVLFGVPGSPMLSFARSLSDLEVAAVVSFVRFRWGRADRLMAAPELIRELRNLYHPERVASPHLATYTYN